jgi:hypothetical protein
MRNASVALAQTCGIVFRVFVVEQLIMIVKIVRLVSHGTLFKKFAVIQMIWTVNSV